MRIRFGERFLADLETGELFRNGRLQHLQDKPFRLLELLLLRPTRLASYSEIERYLWPDVNVDARHGIKQAAQKVRHALGSDAHRLQCLRGRGYRLMAAATTLCEETQHCNSADATPGGLTPAPAETRSGVALGF